MTRALTTSTPDLSPKTLARLLNDATKGPLSVEDPMGAEEGLWIVQSGKETYEWEPTATVHQTPGKGQAKRQKADADLYALAPSLAAQRIADADAIARLTAALVEHNDLLRSALEISKRGIIEGGASTNWDAFHDRVAVALKRHHATTNEARETGGPQ